MCPVSPAQCSSPLRTLLAFALVGLGLGAAACTEVGSDPQAPVAIELKPPSSPAILRGDTLRDSTGAAVPLTALVYNAQGDVISGAPVQFLEIDSVPRLTLDATTGIVIGNDTGQALVVVSAGSLQSIPDTLVVVDTPTVAIQVDTPPDTLVYTFSPTAGDTLVPLGVRAVHVADVDTAAVRRIVVRYSFVHPAVPNDSDSTHVQLVDEARRASLSDTTDATGLASRSIRISPFTIPFSDSVVVRADIRRPDGTDVPGSPIVFRMFVTVQ
jgi:hypothetical protein